MPWLVSSSKLALFRNNDALGHSPDFIADKCIPASVWFQAPRLICHGCDLCSHDHLHFANLSLLFRLVLTQRVGHITLFIEPRPLFIGVSEWRIDQCTLHSAEVAMGLEWDGEVITCETGGA